MFACRGGRTSNGIPFAGQRFGGPSEAEADPPVLHRRAFSLASAASLGLRLLCPTPVLGRAMCFERKPRAAVAVVTASGRGRSMGVGGRPPGMTASPRGFPPRRPGHRFTDASSLSLSPAVFRAHPVFRLLGKCVCVDLPQPCRFVLSPPAAPPALTEPCRFVPSSGITRGSRSSSAFCSPWP